MHLTLALNSSARTLDLTHYPDLIQDNDEQCLDTVQIALEIGLRAVTQIHGTLDRQTIQTLVEQLIRESNLSLQNETTNLLSRLAEDSRQFNDQHNSLTRSTIMQITEILDDHKTAIMSQLSLDTADSSVKRVSELLTKQVGELRDMLTAFTTRKAVEARSSAGGMPFEQSVGALLSDLTQFSGDVCQPVGELPGLISNSKVGDFLITLGEMRHVPNSRIVIEAKRDNDYTKAKAINECEVARKNRAAQVAIFVWHEPYGMAKKQARIEVIGRQAVVVLWDADNPATDVYLHAAYWIACALIMPLPAENPVAQVQHDTIERTVNEIGALSAQIEDIHKSAELIRKQSQTILQATDNIKPTLEASVEFLKRQVTALFDKHSQP